MSITKQFLQTNQAELLVLLYFFVQPWGNSFLVPLIIMSLLGLRMVIKWRSLNYVDQQVIKRVIVLASCIWLPIVISLPDAIAFNRTLLTTLNYPMYVLAGLYLAIRLSRQFNHDLFLKILIPVIVFWGLTSLSQLFTIVNWFEPIEDTDGRAHGIFDGNLMLGVILGSLVPFANLAMKKRNLATLTFLLFSILIIVATGTRSAWLTSFVFIFFYIVVIWAELDAKKMAILYGLIIFLSVLLFTQTSINSRLSRSLEIFSFTNKSLEHASAGRLSIWKDAVNLGLTHPFNGVGANNFRYGQAEVAPINSRWLWHSDQAKDGFNILGSAHTHQLILETWSNTGTPGLIGLLFFYIIIFKEAFTCWHKRNYLALGGLFGLIAAIFPLGSHNNFYGSWMIGWLWVWIGISQGLVFNRQVKIGNPL